MPQPQQCRDLSHICDLCRSLWQCWILKPMIEIRESWSNLNFHGHCVRFLICWVTQELPFQYFIFVFCLFFRATLCHSEVSRLGGRSELQLPVYTTGAAMWDLSHTCNLHHSSWQCWILNPLSKARDQTRILMDTSWVLNPLSYNRNSLCWLFIWKTSLPEVFCLHLIGQKYPMRPLLAARKPRKPTFLSWAHADHLDSVISKDKGGTGLGGI